VKFAVSLVALSLTTICLADPIDDYIRGEMAKNRIPGLVVGIVDHGHLNTRCYGFADLELDVKTTPDNIFEIGSITKQFTSFAAMKLVEDGKLSLDDPVSKYIPEAPAAWKDIKIRHLLYQTSGLQDYAFVPGIGLTDEFDRATWMSKMAPLALDFDPGSSWSYSNTNYALMGWIIEKAAGKSYQQYVSDVILKPLEMSNTSFDDTYAIVKNRAHGYLNADPTTQIRVRPGSMTIASDGSLMTTVADMAKWDTALQERKLLRPSSYDLLWANATLNNGRKKFYGMGWNLTLPDSPPYVGHGGNSVGYSAGFVRYPKDGISVIVLGNVYAFGGESTARTVAELYQPSLKPKPLSTVPDPQAARTAQVKMALLALAENKPDANLLEPEIIGPMKTARAGMSQAFVPLKDIAQIDFAGSSPSGSDQWLSYLIKTSKRTYAAYILWSKENRLAQILLRGQDAK
jgi:CubicO group peptidase (beta-lactamase class C family)